MLSAVRRRTTGKSFFERDPLLLGITGTVLVVLLLVAAVNIGNLPLVKAGREYRVELSEAGGLTAGDDVQVAGHSVGEVESVALSGQHVDVTLLLTDDAVVVGDRTTARVVSVNLLGKKAVELEPGGAESLPIGATLPESVPAYDITEVLEGLTGEVGELDVRALQQAMQEVARTFEDTAAPVGRALDGLDEVAGVIGDQETELNSLLKSAREVTGVLAGRNAEVDRLLTNGSTLLTALQARRTTITALLVNATAVARELSGLQIDQRDRLAPALRSVRLTIGLLNRNKEKLSAAIEKLGPYATALGEAVGSGPFFTAYVPNFSQPTSLPFFPGFIRDLLYGSTASPTDPPADSANRQVPTPGNVDILELEELLDELSGALGAELDLGQEGGTP